MILAGALIHEVAVAVKVGRSTISEWIHKDGFFKTKLEELRSQAEDELRFSAPMTNAFMMAQLRNLAESGPPESRLKAVQFYFEKFGIKDSTTTSGLSAGDALILKAMQKCEMPES